MPWSLFDPEKLEEIERKLIEASCVRVERHRVMIGSCNFVYCLTCGDQEKPPLVILHGYGGAGMVFFKVLKKLTLHFYVYLVDHLGMGRSSRPTFTPKTIPQVEKFYTDAIEEFRKHFNLSKFVLAGHSFGGYIAGCYMLKYKTHVEKLLFLSAVGIPSQPPNYNYVKSLKGSWGFRLRETIITSLWVKNITPLVILRKLGPFGHNFMQGMFGDRVAGISKEESNLILSYIEQISSMPGSGEFGLALVISPGSWAKYPLINRFHNLQVPIAFMFGDRDWVMTDGAKEMQERSNAKVVIYILSDSDHHMYWDNPEGLAEEIIRAVRELE